MSTLIPAARFAFNDAGRPVAVANAEFYPTIASIILEDPGDTSSPWHKYRDIRYITDPDERTRLLGVMAGRALAAEPAGDVCRCCDGNGCHYDEHWRQGGSPAVCHACTRGRILPDRDYQSCRRRSRSEAPDLDRGA